MVLGGDYIVQVFQLFGLPKSLAIFFIEFIFLVCIEEENELNNVSILKKYL